MNARLLLPHVAISLILFTSLLSMVPSGAMARALTSPQHVKYQSRQASGAKPGAYMIILGRDYNRKDLRLYFSKLPAIYKKYGGTYVAASRNYDVLEGCLDTQAVIITAWPSRKAALAFWNSPEYREAIKLRRGIGSFDITLVPALPGR